MAYTTNISLTSLDGSDSYKNTNGNHECVELVRQVTKAPQTATWKQGKRVLDCTTTEIKLGTIIATFDEKGHYPSFARHAAIYESHNQSGINVIDQWNKKGKATRRTIYLKNSPVRIVDDAKWYYVVE